MIDFPASPATGQTFDPGTGIVYAFDGVAWNAVTSSTATARSRNRLTNGSMQVSQEYGSTAVTVANGYPADMWQLSFGGVSGQAVRSAVLPSPDGSTLAYFQSIGVVKASLAASDYCQNLNTIEGQNVADFLWGTAAAKQVILRFNAYAEVAGLYSVAILNGASNRTYLKGINLTTGWQTFVLVIPGDTTGTWPIDNTGALSVRFCSVVGSTYVGVDGAWQAGAMLGVPGQLNGAAQANKNIVFTDVGLYLDPDRTGLAPKFELPDYGTELVKCQRYWRPNPQLLGRYVTSNEVQMFGNFQPMRINPTVALIVTANAVVELGVSARTITGVIGLTAYARGEINVDVNATGTSPNMATTVGNTTVFSISARM